MISDNPLVARSAAAVVALTALLGLIIQFGVTWQLQGSVSLAVWTLLEYFTITTNGLVLIVFAASAVKPSAVQPSLVACTTLNIVLVGAVYGLLLHGLSELSGYSSIANVIVHGITPVVVPLFWLLFTPKGRLRRKDMFTWAAYPLGYFAYALVRGEFTHRYPYPFVNVIALGWARVVMNAAGIAVVFLAVAWVFLWVDTLLGRRGSTGTRVSYEA